MTITRTPLAPSIGLEIGGVDLEKPFDEATKKEVLDAWIQAGVVLFRNCRSDEAHMRLSSLFGEMQAAATGDLNDERNPFMMKLEYDPSIAKKKGIYIVDGVQRAGWLGWHWDQAFMPQIVRGAALRMVEPSERNGETGFIDAIGAYDRLSEDLKRRIEGLEVVYEFTGAQERNRFGFPDVQLPPGRDITGTPSDPNRFKFPAAVHPLVITQRETGRKVLKLSPMHAKYILGMDRAESDALLEELANHLVNPEYAHFHQWTKDDIVVWDNWRVIHSAKGIPVDCVRRARRTTIAGDYKVGRYLDPTLKSEQFTARFDD